MKLSDFLVRDAIIADLQATTKEGAFREIVRGLQEAGRVVDVDLEELTRILVEREDLSSQSIGLGVACPEGWHSAVERVIGTIALSHREVDFKAPDGIPVDIIFLLLGPPVAGQPSTPGDILHAWAAVARCVQANRFLGCLRQCGTREEIFDLILEVERTAP